MDGPGFKIDVFDLESPDLARSQRMIHHEVIDRSVSIWNSFQQTELVFFCNPDYRCLGRRYLREYGHSGEGLSVMEPVTEVPQHGHDVFLGFHGQRFSSFFNLFVLEPQVEVLDVSRIDVLKVFVTEERYEVESDVTFNLGKVSR